MKYGILKNCDKFNNIKFKPAINLQYFSTRKRNEKTDGVSITKYGKVWFKTENGLALFKTYDGKNYKTSLKNMRMANELICSSLANQIGIPCAKYETAQLNGDTGLVSYNFLKPKQSVMSLFHFLGPISGLETNLVDIAERIDSFKHLGYEINKEQTILTLYKYLVFDVLTLQTDRHSENINFILDKNNYSISLAPMIDSEFAFNIENIELFKNSSKTITFNDILVHYSGFSKSVDVQCEIAGNPKRYMHNIQNIVDLAHANPEMMDFLNTSLRKFSISKAIEDTEKMGIEISDEYKEYISKIVFYTKRIFRNQIMETKNEPSSGLYEEYIK